MLLEMTKWVSNAGCALFVFAIHAEAHNNHSMKSD
jgi:hypothetical protein